MKGCRPLSNAEIEVMSQSFRGLMRKRNRLLFLTGIATGFRISEILSLRVKDVLTPKGRFVHEIRVERKSMKGRKESRGVELNPILKRPLKTWLQELERQGLLLDHIPIFCNFSGRTLSRVGAWKILRDAYAVAGIFDIQRRLGSHSLRKSFGRLVYEKYCEMRQQDPLINPLQLTRLALGHKNLDTTVKYLSFRETDVAKGVRSIGSTFSLEQKSRKGDS